MGTGDRIGTGHVEVTASAKVDKQVAQVAAPAAGALSLTGSKRCTIVSAETIDLTRQSTRKCRVLSGSRTADDDEKSITVLLGSEARSCAVLFE